MDVFEAIFKAVCAVFATVFFTIAALSVMVFIGLISEVFS